MRPAGHPALLALLGLPAWVYGGLVHLRNQRYERPGASCRAGIPVLSVGNLTVGGTGKTPIVAWLARRLLDMDHRPAIVSRGYGGRAGRGPRLVSAGRGATCAAAICGDEPYMLSGALPGALVIVGSDRHAGAELARRRGADVVLLDDGFQHRRLARDLDIVLLDAENPFGNGRLLPAGPLREPVGNLRRAGLILVTRSGADRDLSRIERVVRRHNPTAPILRAGHRPIGFTDPSGTPVPVPPRALAFCGIGNPGRFRRDLESMDLQLVGFVAHADHHVYSAGEVASLRRQARDGRAALVTTEKDLARLEPWVFARDEPGLLALKIEAEVFEPEVLLAAIRRALGRGAG